MIAESEVETPRFYTRTFFRVNFPTEYGESVYVIGSDKNLGNWDIENGHQLSTAEEFTPVWYSTTPVHLPLNKDVQYKYAAYNPSDKSIRWESEEGNRYLRPSGPVMTVEDDDGLFRQKYQSDFMVEETPETSNQNYTEESCNSFEIFKQYEARYLKNMHIEDDSTVLIVSFELPIKVHKLPDGNFTVEMRKASVLPILYNIHFESPLNIKFFGTPGIHNLNDYDKKKLTDLLEQYNCVPIFIDEKTFNDCVEFCHKVIWPAFHNVMPAGFNMLSTNSQKQWEQYQTVNRIFGEVIVTHCHERDMIWIHDYHHLVLPVLLIRKLKRANIGLFLHIPFPSYEIFRCLPMREKLIKGMLFADLIGFHIFEYANNFFKACAYLSGYEQYPSMGGGFTLECDGHNVSVHIGHVNIQYEETRNKLETSPKIQQIAKQLDITHKNKFIFCSVDRCEFFAGLDHKIQAFSHFLQNYPDARGKAVLIQYAYPFPGLIDESKRLGDMLEKMVEEVNTKFANYAEKHIYLYVGEVFWEDKYALYQISHCFLNTSLRDGFNLNPFEYICCRKDRPSSLILSEFIGCTRSLSSSLRCNPWQLDQIAEQMITVMKYGENESQKLAFNRDQLYLQSHNTQEWARDFLLNLKIAKKRDDVNYVIAGFAYSSRLVGMPLNFSYLNYQLVLQALKSSKRRFFFFDYEGTLAYDRRRINALPDPSLHSDEPLSSYGNEPPEEIKNYLRELMSDVHNTVVILSGRDRKHLETWFGDVKGLGLCAEHGFYYKVPALTNEVWHCASNNVNFEWKNVTQTLLSNYVKSTQGSFIENKGSALVFQYRDAHAEFGQIQAQDLSHCLKSLLRAYPVQVVQGKGYVEVRLTGINKGETVSKILNQLSSLNGDADFILCIGDDRSDEDMFKEINTREKIANKSRNCSIEGDEAFFSYTKTKRYNSMLSHEDSLTPLSASMESDTLPYTPSNTNQLSGEVARRYFTCTVGNKISTASYYLNDTKEVSDLLKSIVTAMNSPVVSSLSFNSGEDLFSNSFH